MRECPRGVTPASVSMCDQTGKAPACQSQRLDLIKPSFSSSEIEKMKFMILNTQK